MSDTIAVAPSFVQKVIGLVEANKGMQTKKAEDQQALRAKATEAVTTLASKGYVEADKSASLIDSIVKNPVIALEALNKMAADADHVDEKIASVGKPDGNEKTASASPKRKESDQIWDQGFGIKS